MMQGPEVYSIQYGCISMIEVEYIVELKPRRRYFRLGKTKTIDDCVFAGGKC